MDDGFEDSASEQMNSAPFLIKMEDYEGPLDLLLDLSRKKKFDLAKISIAELARQYIHFIETAQRLKIEIAADYLVMATYLAWLKSRLLTHDEDEDDEETLSPELQAENLRVRLLHLEQIKIRADQLMKRLQIGRDIFKNGKPEHMGVREQAKYDASLLELLRAYGDITMRGETGEF
nr:segregation/condensation protein A [Alphaproteobacteria bacterium]